jgi:hypothetical protein
MPLPLPFHAPYAYSPGMSYRRIFIQQKYFSAGQQKIDVKPNCLNINGKQILNSIFVPKNIPDFRLLFKFL